MAVINIAGAHARFLLRGDAGCQFLLRESSEVVAQQVRTILGEGDGQGLPGAAPVAGNVASGNLLHLPWSDVRGVELHPGAVSGKARGAEDKEQGKHQCMPHCCPPTFTSLPMTTPEATEMVAGPGILSSTCAISFLTGTSTVLSPAGLLAVKVTTVPSETGLPLQSRTGAVCTRIPLGLRSALICRWQASEPTCWMTRASSIPSSAATNCALPALLPEFIRIQAAPSRVRTLWAAAGAFL